MRKIHQMLISFSLVLLVAGTTATFAFTEVEEELQVPRRGWVSEEGLLIRPTEKASLDRSSELKSLTERYGGNWRFNKNALTGSFHRIYGSGFQFAGAILSETDAEQSAHSFVSANPELFSADLDALKTAEIRNGAGKWVVHFNQVVNGARVVGGRAHVVFTESGRIFAMGSDVYPNVLDKMGGTLPILSEADAMSIATSEIGFIDGTDIITHNELVILPVREETDELLGLDYRLAYRLDLFVHNPRSHWSTYVDADTGEILWRESMIRTIDFTGHVQGDVEWDSYCDGYTYDYPVDQMIVNISGVGSATTDTNGDFTLSYGGSDTRSVTAGFISQYLNVDRYTGTNAQFSGSITPGSSLTIDWSNSNSLPSERDCFAYLNHQHRWLNELDPSFTGLDYEMPCSVERTDGYCPGNAWYDYYGVNFCSESSSYGNTGRLGDVAYHEYGHGITHEIYDPNDPPSDLHEGNSDVAALLLTREPILGLGFYLNNCSGGIRTAENTMHYPEDLTGSGHTDGQIISGFIWDSWQELMDAFPWEYADEVIADDWHFARMLGLPQNMPDQIYWTFVADDDDGNLDNGTPHHAYLCVGATNHGFDCPEIISPLAIAHAPVIEQTSTTDPTAITATITSNVSINESACRVYYRVDGGSFSNVGMTSVGGDDFTGYIPAQAACTYVEYYIYGEDNNSYSATHPSNAPVSLHGFSVGEITLVFEDDFESDNGWAVGAAGDAATTGVWERCDPQGTDAQAENDNTPSPGVNAYITQCASGSGQGTYDIDGGKTTLISPVFDLSSYSSATVSYYRWYSNNTGASPNEDVWVVEVTDDGWSTWATLENTTATDRSWLQMQFDLGTHVSLNNQVQFRFIAADEGSGSIVEAGVDDFMISSCGGEVIDTEPPSVTVTAPNGGEEIDALTQYTITWTSSDNVGITETKVYLSTDGGTTYPDLLTTLVDETSYDWTVPDIDQADCRIRVVCTDAETNEGSDTSDSNFRIIPHDGEAPEVTVTAPNGGEEIDALTQYTITWTSSDNVGITETKVYLSTNGGATYPDLLATLADETSYDWTVPDIDQNDCRIQVVCTDAETNEGSDASDSNFRIIPHDGEAPEVTVTAPNGGEEIDALTQFNITWTSSDNVGITETKVYLSTDGGTTYPDLLTTLVDETSYDWTVPDIDQADCRIRVVCTDAETNEGSDASDANFRIIPHDGEAPEVTVTAPNGGEEIDALTQYTITWTSSDNVGITETKVYLSTNGGATYPDLLATLADETSYDWTVPDIDQNDCRIQVVCTDAETNEGSDASDANFRIIPHDGEAPEVTVTAPNGGEEIDALTQYTITWTSSDNVGITETKVYLSTDGGTTYPDLLTTLADETSYDWTVPDIDQNDCRIRVVCTDAETNEGSDASDANFRIIPHDGEAPEATVTAPNGGEEIDALTQFNITWTSSDNVGITETKVYLSTDGGATYPDLLATLVDETSYDWTVPDIDQNDCRIQVVCTDAETNEGSDASDANFRIIPHDSVSPTVTVTAPNGGEELEPLSLYTIAWTSSDNIGVIETAVILSIDGGLTYPDTLITLVDETSFDWTVPDVDEPDCRIKVVCLDPELNEGSDESDADFSIADVSGIGQLEAPAGLVLRKSRPNPFAGMTRIEFGLPTAQQVTLGVYSVKGELIKMLANGEYSPGFHTLTWRGRNDSGERVGSGLYFYRLISNGKVLKQKMLLLK